MTTLRFDFQRECARRALAELDGFCLNVGCNNDPGALKGVDPQRVINCDLFAYDTVGGWDNATDVTFDAAHDRWPFKDRTCALVVLGDILEHMKPVEIDHVLTEARRVAFRLCITVPEDTRETTTDERADEYPQGAVHRTIVTEGLLRSLLTEAWWEVTDWQHVEYDNGRRWGQQVMGHFVQAE